MDVNASLIVQIIVFIVFVGVTMKFIWPPLIGALEDRRKSIADGLAAAERGHKELEQAEIKSKEIVAEAKSQAVHIIEQANQRANHIVEEAKNKARAEGEQLLQLAKGEIKKEYNAAKSDLLKQISDIAVAGAEKILQREVDKASNDQLVDELVNEI